MRVSRNNSPEYTNFLEKQLGIILLVNHLQLESINLMTQKLSKISSFKKIDRNFKSHSDNHFGGVTKPRKVIEERPSFIHYKG